MDVQVNIIPVIGKADSCTPLEVEKFKAKVGRHLLLPNTVYALLLHQILVQLDQHKIQIYGFPEAELEPEVCGG
jgi:septin family protein